MVIIHNFTVTFMHTVKSVILKIFIVFIQMFLYICVIQEIKQNTITETDIYKICVK